MGVLELSCWSRLRLAMYIQMRLADMSCRAADRSDQRGKYVQTGAINEANTNANARRVKDSNWMAKEILICLVLASPLSINLVHYG